MSGTNYSERPPSYSQISLGPNQNSACPTRVDERSPLRPRNNVGSDVDLISIRKHFLCIAVLIPMAVVGALVHSQFTRWNRLSAIGCATPYSSDPTVSTTYWFDPLKYPNLHVRLDDTVFGKVLVSEAESPFDKNVRVNIKISASMPSILEGIAPRIRLPEYQSQLAEIWLDTTSLTREARENIRERLCALAVIEIVYPLPVNYTGSNSTSLEQLYPASLNVETYNTQITVDVRSQAFRSRLAISNMGEIGSIHIISAASTKLTVLALAQGKISGRLSTQQAVYANVQGVGEVSLVIDANDRIVSPSSDKLQALDLSVSTDGPVRMQLFSPTSYRGRFNMENNNTSPPYLYCSRDDQYVLLTTSDEHRLAGYISDTKDGEEPTTLLPNIELISRGFGSVSLELIG